MLLPIVISINIFNHYHEEGNKINVVSIQPNVDPHEKFVSFTPEQQVDTILKLAYPFIHDSIDYIIVPETVVTGYTDIDNLEGDYNVKRIKKLATDHPAVNYILGMMLVKTYFNNNNIPNIAQLNKSGNSYDTYNSAVQINSCSIQYYHKSKLFPGVESIPYSEYLGFLNGLIIQLGGTYRNHSISEERVNLVSCNDSVSVATKICWENIYGEFITGFIRNGANVIFNITNEGWWGNTPGHKMFKKYAQLRAIETRKSVVRSANTGISAIIDQKGEIIKELIWGKKGVVAGSVCLNDKISFYTLHGDYIGRFFKILSGFFLLALILYTIIAKLKRK